MEQVLHRGLRNSVWVDRMREQEMVAGDLIMEDNVKCAQEVEGWDLLAEHRFIVQDGEIIKLWEGDLEVTCMKERMGEDLVESHTDSFVEQILTAVNMEGRLYNGNQLPNWSINGLSLPCILLVIQGN